MLLIGHYLTKCFQRFSHTFIFLFGFTTVIRGEGCHRAFSLFFCAHRATKWHRLLQAIVVYDLPAKKSIQKFTETTQFRYKISRTHGCPTTKLISFFSPLPSSQKTPGTPLLLDSACYQPQTRLFIHALHRMKFRSQNPS